MSLQQLEQLAKEQRDLESQIDEIKDLVKILTKQKAKLRKSLKNTNTKLSKVLTKLDKTL